MSHNFYINKGGEDNSFAAEYAMLKEYGYDVEQFTINNDIIPELGKIRTAGKTMWNNSAGKQIGKIVREKKIDISHFQNTFPLISPAAYYSARSQGSAVVQSLRNYRMTCVNGTLSREGQICEACLGNFAPMTGIRNRCYHDSSLASSVVAGMIASHKIIGTYNKKIDAYIAISHFVKGIYERSGINPDLIHVKPNLVWPDPEVGRGIGDYAMYAGRLTREKGIMTVINAWKELKRDMPLVIVGDGPLRKEVELSTQNPMIKYLGQKSMEDVYKLIGDASFLVVPSEWHEPFGRTVIEAYAKGTPVITTRMGGLSEIVIDGETGLTFEAGNISSLLSILEYVAQNPSFMRSRRQRVRCEFLEKYTASSNIETLRKIYDTALYNRHGAKNV